jgi:AAA15 family ATPase/GTPase
MKLKQIRVDGYKNLINCVVNLGDFNVFVGPNNSGKSNLLEAVQILLPLCFGDDDLRNSIFEGQTPPPRFGSSICHLEEHKRKPMTIGIGFEIEIKDRLWRVDYDVTIQCGESQNEIGFLRELLTAKEIQEPIKTGRAKIYISREGKELRIREHKKKGLKKHAISKNNSSLLAIRSLYADFQGLSPEFQVFSRGIFWISLTKIFALSPRALRRDIDSEKSIEDLQVSSFDLSFIADNIKKENKYYNLFEESLCHILDLEDVHFEAEDIPTPIKKEGAKEKIKRMRILGLKRIGDRISLIEEYSDGTLVVAAILEALFSKNDRGPILCLEELENCLHPSAIEKLLRFLQDHSEDWPVLITTHSPYLLSGVRPEDVNVAVIDETGATHFEKVKNSRQLREYLNKNLMSFGELLVSNFEDFREV